jgi:GR25 family glycosyltransferase involved in LPS biosynthesis
MSFSSSIRRVYCISLPRSADRLDAFTESWANATGNTDIIPISATEPRQDVLSEKADETLEYPARGMIGCTLSHLKALTHAMRGNCDAMVFEDDCEFSELFKVRTELFLHNAPKDWDILYLGGEPTQQLRIVRPGIARVDSLLWGTYAYVVNWRALPVLFQCALDNITHTSFDVILSQRAPNLVRYAMTPPACKTRPGISTIHGDYRDWSADTDAKWAEYEA